MDKLNVHHLLIADGVPFVVLQRKRLFRSVSNSCDYGLMGGSGFRPRKLTINACVRTCDRIVFESVECIQRVDAGAKATA